MQAIKSTKEKMDLLCEPKMAMQIRRYNAKRIAHGDRSRATLDAIRHRHWVSICPVSPRQTSWSSILAQKIVVAL